MLRGLKAGTDYRISFMCLCPHSENVSTDNLKRILKKKKLQSSTQYHISTYIKLKKIHWSSAHKPWLVAGNMFYTSSTPSNLLFHLSVHPVKKKLKLTGTRRRSITEPYSTLAMAWCGFHPSVNARSSVTGTARVFGPCSAPTTPWPSPRRTSPGCNSNSTRTRIQLA